MERHICNIDGTQGRVCRVLPSRRLSRLQTNRSEMIELCWLQHMLLWFVSLVGCHLIHCHTNVTINVGCHCLLQIHVYPFEHEKAQASVKKPHTTAPANGQSRKERRHAQWTPCAQQREAAATAVAAVALTTQPRSVLGCAEV